MIDHKILIVSSAAARTAIRTIARKVYFLSPSVAFSDNYDLQLALYDEICEFLKLPISAIRLVGSAHTGFSLVRGTPFDPEKSDLDIAIVDAGMYLQLFEEAFEQTRGWEDTSKFAGNFDALGRKNQFLRYLRKGVIRPDLMPSSPLKAEWTNFFGKLGDKYATFCRGITAGVYARESFMAAKQESAIKMFLENEVSR